MPKGMTPREWFESDAPGHWSGNREDKPRPIGDAEIFARMMTNFSDFGEWVIREMPMRGSVLPPMMAKISGRNGHVEVWGGRAHRTEVWFIGRDKDESLVAYDCHAADGSLRYAIAQACNLAGVQAKLF